MITPRPRPSTTRGSPFGAGVEWLVSEERFTFYGGGITFIPSTPSERPPVADPATPVNGPFSVDFKWVTLPEIQAAPIQFTLGQASVFEALWAFKGAEVDGEQVMKCAGLDSDKPIDLFKIKSKDKNKPVYEARLAAYQALVITQQREGLYAMPCAAGALS